MEHVQVKKLIFWSEATLNLLVFGLSCLCTKIQAVNVHVVLINGGGGANVPTFNFKRCFYERFSYSMYPASLFDYFDFLVFVLAYHWSFGLYDIIFYSHYKLGLVYFVFFFIWDLSGILHLIYNDSKFISSLKTVSETLTIV